MGWFSQSTVLLSIDMPITIVQFDALEYTLKMFSKTKQYLYKKLYYCQCLRCGHNREMCGFYPNTQG